MDENDATPGAKTAKDAASKSLLTFKWMLETLALPAALVFVPLWYQSREASRTLADQQFRLYTELLNKREEVDAQVRRGLFEKLLGGFLDANPTSIDTRIVELELLSLNFHGSLNLAPLFWDADRKIDALPAGKSRDDYHSRLDWMARQVKDRQIAQLVGDGAQRGWDVNLAKVFEGAAPITEGFVVSRAGWAGRDAPEKRYFTVTVFEHDADKRSLKLQVAWGGSPQEQVRFSIDAYDFPLVNFTRLSADERFAIVVDAYQPEQQNVRLKFLYFSSGRAGSNDRPYIDDVMSRLAHPEERGVAAVTIETASAPASR
jgi:hypothetical protein